MAERPAKDFTPRYFAIEQWLRDLISRSDPGDGLPSESDLCEQFDVSRMTARHAMQRLVQEGLIHRIPGRGSFVADPAVHRQATKLVSFTEEMKRRGRVPSSVIMTFGARPPRVEERASLKLTGGAEIIEVHRTRLADGIAVAHERAILTWACRGILDSDISAASLHELLRQMGIRPTRGRATIAAEPATAEDAELLGVERDSPMLVERKLIFDQRDQPFEYTASRYAADRYRLEVAFDVEDPTGG